MSPGVTRYTTIDQLPEMVTPEEAMRFLDISKNAIYELIKSGELASVRFGRLIRIRKTALLGEDQ